jgi:hypothetical protein
MKANRDSALAESGRYSVRLLTRNTESARAKALASLPNVTLFRGTQDDSDDLRRAFKGVYGAWVNLDGFTLGEKNELFYGFRAYELARAAGVQHYVWANIEYALKIADFNEGYHCGHMDSKGRIGEFILAQGQDVMKTSLLGTGPYMEMLMDGMFVPQEQEDGTLVWMNPCSKSIHFPFALFHFNPTELARWLTKVFSLWLFDNVSESAGMNLAVATDDVSFHDIARIVTEITGKTATFKSIPFEAYADVAEPYPGAYVNWSLGPDVPRDDSVMRWRDNFRSWWRYWGEGLTPQRDYALLDRIHPGRIKSLADWIKKTGYEGRPRPVLKMVEDWRAKSGKLSY